MHMGKATGPHFYTVLGCSVCVCVCVEGEEAIGSIRGVYVLI